MGQVSVNWVEVEATVSVYNAQEKTCEWEEAKDYSGTVVRLMLVQ